MRNALNIQDPLLVSSPNGGGMALLDGPLCLPLSVADCTGLAVGANTVLWCLQQDGARAVREFRDGQMRTVTLSSEPLDLHDVFLAGKDVFVVATQTNEVLRLDRKLAVKERWRLDGEQDSSHINSVTVHDGRLLASVFGRFTDHRGYKGNTRGAGQVVDVRTGDTVIDGLSQPHSMVSESGRLYLCSSEDKELHVYDEEFRKVEEVGLPGYARGLALGREHVYVGLSCSRNMEIQSQTGFLETGAVAVLQRSDLSLIGTVQVPWKEVYDVRVIQDRVLLGLLLAASWQIERTDTNARLLAIEQERIVHAEVSALAASRQRELESKDARIAAAETAMKARESSVANLQAKAHERDEKIVAMQRVIKEREASYAALQERTRERDERIGVIQQEAREHEAHIAGLQTKIRERDERISAIQQEAREQGTRIAGLQAKIRERDEQINVMKDGAQERSADLAELRLKLSERDQHLRSVRAALEQREAHFNEVRLKAREHNENAKAMKKALHDGLEKIAALEHRAVQRDQRMQSMGEALKNANRNLHEVRGALTLRDGRVSELEASLQRAVESELAQSRRASDLAIRVSALEEVEREHGLIVRSRSWRMTRPLRFAMRLVRERNFSEADRERLRGLLGLAAPRSPGVRSGMPSLPSPPPSAPIAATSSPGGAGVLDANAAYRKLAPWRLRREPRQVAPAQQRNGVDDVFVWGVIDWHFRIQRPQHLARELAASGRRVFYISNNFIDALEPGFKVEPLDDGGNLFQVFLNVSGKQVIYFDPPSEAVQAQLEASLRAVLEWAGSSGAVSLVQHPYWAQLARKLPNHRMVYDCMDHHGGFDNNGSRILEAEQQLMREADLLVVSSVWLDEEGAKFNSNRALIRNAGQYEHFSTPPEKPYTDPEGRRIIGYYGAIAPWFDLDLVDRVAAECPDCLILLVGADTCGAQERLAHRANVKFTGEIPYADLPSYLYAFDVCMLPFQVIPLTLATNPVKAYEYLSAGRPVVTVDLPEMRQFGSLVDIAHDADGFVANVRSALEESESDPVKERRREFASGQTWAHRAAALMEAVAAIPEPRVSVVVLTYNNLDLTKACLDSIDAYSDYSNMEIIVVDNASGDGSLEYLREWVSEADNRKLVANEVNRGFAAGNNQGLDAADGEYLVLLNNDTRVTPGWLRTMLAHVRQDASIGIVGPVTNNIGNEARIETDYDDEAGMLRAARNHTLRHAGELMELRTVAFFCVMIPRRVYDRIGGLDEDFGVGFFEDDDYCRRIEQLGLRVVCAEDVFVHHHLSASFNKLGSGQKKDLFDRNKAIYEAKWGEWVPHRYRPKKDA